MSVSRLHKDYQNDRSKIKLSSGYDLVKEIVLGIVNELLLKLLLY